MLLPVIPLPHWWRDSYSQSLFITHSVWAWSLPPNVSTISPSQPKDLTSPSKAHKVNVSSQSLTYQPLHSHLLMLSIILSTSVLTRVISLHPLTSISQTSIYPSPLPLIFTDQSHFKAIRFCPLILWYSSVQWFFGLPSTPCYWSLHLRVLNDSHIQLVSIITRTLVQVTQHPTFKTNLDSKEPHAKFTQES